MKRYEGHTFKSEDFSQTSLAGSFFLDCVFQNCNLTESILQNAKICSCHFLDCNLSLIKIDGCRFQDVHFETCKILGAEFFKCEPSPFSIACKNCMLHYCNFSGLKLKKISFLGSKLKECYFTDNSLVEADFSKVDLAGTIFQNCDLSKADLSSAINYQIDPQTNKIKKAKFSLPEAISLLRCFDIILD